MYFPFSYTGELVFYKPNDFDLDLFIKQIKSQVLICESDNEKLLLSAPFSYTKQSIKITLTVRDENTSILCSYEISMLENNLVFLLSIVFAIFFFHFDKILIGFTATVFGLLFYFLNTIKISNSIKTIIYNPLGGKTDLGFPELWQKQQQWMKDKTLCPACGESKNKYSNKCINCGLYFTANQPQTNCVNTSLTVDKEIVYEVIKRRK